MSNSGLILLNKKTGITSFDALGGIKRALGTGKVGHTGTLDKFASGLLVVLVGKALKLSRWFSHCDKKYYGRIRLGEETDTLDPEGEIIAKAELPTREETFNVLSRFTGEIMQAPPAYSAIHINGKRASSLARSGKIPEMKKRPVTIYKLELLSWQPPFADIFVHCSSGTYIRSLARDIALAAGSRGHLDSLKRTQVANFKIGNEEPPLPAPYSLLPINKEVISSLGGMQWLEVSQAEAQQIFQGKLLDPIMKDKPLSSRNQAAAVFCEETIIAVVENDGAEWKYCCVIG